MLKRFKNFILNISLFVLKLKINVLYNLFI